MAEKKNARLAALAVLVVFASSMAVLLARQLNLGPDRPAPAWRVFGPAGARIQIYEYTDLACPACRHASEVVDNMLKVYPADVQVHFKHYPLKSIHPWSELAAAYADCAGEQGKFKAYADGLFAAQEKWGRAKERPAEFAAVARGLGLDWAAMEACAASEEARRRVSLDRAEGEVKGVNATPTFFVNGKRAVGGGQLLEQAKAFDKLLKR
jgi:protein-disulfide isomerase